MAQKSASGLSGYTYELPAYVYPRYQYFQSNFTDLKKYFKRLEASGKFHQCISEGDKKLASFYEETERLGSTVTVSVFSEDQKFISTIEKIFLVNQLSEEDKWKKEPASLVKYIEDIGASTDKLEVTVIVVDTLDKELLKDLSLMCQHLTDLQKTMFVLYYRKLSRSYNLTDLESAGFSPAALEDQDASLTFPQHIQNTLEARVVSVFEWMIDFIDDLLPHRTERQGQNFVSFICSDFFDWYENQHILDDLSPVPKTPEEWHCNVCNTTVLLRNRARHEDSKKHKEKLQNLGSAEEWHCNVCNTTVLLRNRARHEDSKKHKEKLQNLGSAGTLSLPAESSQLPAAKLDELFKKKLLEYLSQKTNCRCCDYLGKAYGLKSSLTNYFLEKSLSFEERFKKAVTITTLPTYDDLRTNRSDMFRTFSHTCSDLIRPFLGEVEKFLLKLLEVLERMRRLQFIAQCLLRLTKVKLISKVPDIPKLPPVMQDELLNLPYVTGCGTIFGRLTIHISSLLNLQQEEEIEETLKIHKYTYPYKTEVCTPKFKMQPGDLDFTQGCLIRAKKSNEEYLYGSLGCFVEVSTDDGSTKLHFVTCHHCVDQCVSNVEARLPVQTAQGNVGNLAFKPVGRVTFLQQSEDVALIEVHKQNQNDVNKSLKKPDGPSMLQRWQFCSIDSTFIGRRVYKNGAVTGLTKGCIAAMDYATLPAELMELTNPILISPENAIDQPTNTHLFPDDEENMDQDGGEQPAGADVAGGAGDAGDVFSKEGDSGSAVYSVDVQTGEEGIVIALLIGALNDKDNYLFSYGNVMQSTLDRLKADNAAISRIEPAL